jgi:UDP-3-O-acyl-N-acetylglucosamine deacetylase
LNIDNIILYDNKNYPITNSEYKILNKFISSKNNEINIMDTSITTNLESLNKMKLRLQNKLDNKIKINKVRNKNLWYLSK